MIKTYVLYSILILLIFSAFSCKKESIPTEPVVTGTSQVSGVLKFWDNSTGGYGIIELKSVATNKTVYDTCDENGKYSFYALTAGDYVLTFRSTGPEINTTIISIRLEDKQSIVKDIYITYKYLEMFSSKIISNDVVFLKPQPYGAKLGSNYDLVDHMSGYYRRDYENISSLSFGLYKIPDSFNWSNPGVEITPEYVRANFDSLAYFDEQPVINFTHEVRISGAGLPNFLTPPFNGLALVRRDTTDKILKIPCVDNVNNYFGFIIYYK